MDNSGNYKIDVAYDVEFDEDSGNDDSSDSFGTFNSEATEDCQFLHNKNSKSKSRNNIRRIQNNIGPFGFASHTFSRHNKSIKRFIFVFGLTTSLIVLAQIYLSVNYEFELEGWDRTRNRNVSVYVLPNEETTLIEPSNLCKENSPLLLLIVIFSAPNNFQARQTLRETWANTTEFNYSKFMTLHSSFNGKYLPINYPDWRNYAINNDENEHLSTESSQNMSRDSSFIADSSHADFQIRTVFLIGQTENNETQERLINESRVHNDLIQESFLDSYNNLTLKSIMMVKWINNNCAGKTKFFMKCDDDTFVNVPNLVHFLLGGTIPVNNAVLNHYNARTVQTLDSRNRFSQYENLLVGFQFCHSKPISHSNSKWYTPRYMYDRELFPNYLSGSGYVFTMDTAAKLYNASLNIPFLHLEDVYLTGLCAEKAYVKPKNFHLFSYLSYENVCECRGMITKHEVKLDDMRRAYDSVVNSTIECPAPKEKAISNLKKPSKAC